MGEFTRSAYRRIVLRSTPVRRAISCWLAPRSSSVAIVTRKCGFKTFNPSLPRQKGNSVNVPPQAPRRRRRLSSQVEEFQVATDGGSWPAAGESRVTLVLGDEELLDRYAPE